MVWHLGASFSAGFRGTRQLGCVMLSDFPFLRLIRAVALAALVPFVSDAQTRLPNFQETKPTLQVPRVMKAPRLADFLDERRDHGELRVSDFRQREPRDGATASTATAAFLSYDNHNFYVIFVCKDSPKLIRAHMSKRDDISGDDSVSIMIDTFHDRHRAYMFFVNPLGVQRDGITTEGQADDYSFDGVWSSEGRLTADGYVVWMAIPFKSLRFPRTPVTSWGISLSRNIPHSQEIDTWPQITDRVDAFVPQFGTAEGLREITPSRNLQITPYGFFSNQRFLDTSSAEFPFLHSRQEWRGGMDAKLVLHNSFTIDATVNPDFSQVESDEPQVTINQRYEVFFPEKRPFFTESAGFFETPETLFFSRRIVDPQFGIRSTGKLGKWALGALYIDDRAPGHLLSPFDPVSGARAQIAVGRLQHEFSGQSNLGFFYSRRQFASATNQVFSMDTRIKLTPNWILTAQAAGTASADSAEPTTTGTDFFFEINRSGRNLNTYAYYRDRSTDFHTDLGFVPRTDIRQVKYVAGYRRWPERGALINYGPAIFAVANWDHQGQLQDWYVDLPFYLKFKGPMSFSAGRTTSYELFQNIGFRESVNYVNFSVAKLRWLSFEGSWSRGFGVNYFPGKAHAPFLAGNTEADFGFKLRPNSRIRLESSYVYTRLATSRESGANLAPGIPIFNNHLLRTKLNYQFTRALSLRAIVDYNAVLENASLVDLERSKRVTTDVLLTYLVHPGTAVYLGYSGQKENLRLDPMQPFGLTRSLSPAFSTGRQFFVKVSYQFRF